MISFDFYSYKKTKKKLDKTTFNKNIFEEKLEIKKNMFNLIFFQNTLFSLFKLRNVLGKTEINCLLFEIKFA